MHKLGALREAEEKEVSHIMCLALCIKFSLAYTLTVLSLVRHCPNATQILTSPRREETESHRR